MGLVSKSIPNLINGVSQQPAALRLDTQGEVQENGYSDVVDGLKKRPPTKFLNVLRKDPQNADVGGIPQDLENAFIHTYKRSDDEEYTIVITAPIKSILVFDKDGNNVYDSTAAGDSVSYIPSDPSKLRAVTVADATFIVNTEKVISKTAGSRVNFSERKSLFYLKSVNYGRNYTVTIENSNNGYVIDTAAHTTPKQITEITTDASGDEEHEINSDTLKVSNVINGASYQAGVTTAGLIAQLENTGTCTPSSNLLSYKKEPYFVYENSSTANYFPKVTDDDGGVNFKAFKGTAKSFTDLPNQCVDGFILGVVGDNQKKEDDFYVEFKGTGGSGYWKECAAPNTDHGITDSTMPHMLKQDANGNFSFGTAEDNFGNTWHDRLAGDDNTNAYPSFVGSTISDIFFHRNRLGLLSGENVIFSEAGNYLNFFRTTVRTLLDSDRIDVSVSQNEVADLQRAIPIQDNLLLFSELNQFTLSASQLLTPAEITIDQSTKYECDLNAKPVGAGTSVFFATNKGDFAGVREFFTKTDTEIKEAPEITTHVPTYLEGNVTQLVASSNMDMLIALTDVKKNEIYVYKWYNSSDERLQSSWSKWIFDLDVLHVHFDNSKIKFIFEDGKICEMNLSDNENPYLLDHQIDVYSYYADTGPIIPDDYLTNDMVAVTSEGVNLGPYSNLPLSINPHIKALQRGEYLTFGTPYTFKYQLSEQVFKPKEGDATQLARFQLRKMTFNFSDTGTFDVTVDSQGRDSVTSTFTGRILGQQDNILGQPAIVEEGSFQVGIQSQPRTTKITLTNDSHLPCVFQSAEWEGFVVLRNQRL
jgi:hypothetical protein